MMRATDETPSESRGTTGSKRLGLNQQAAADMGYLFTSSSATDSAVTGLSWVFFILAGIAAASGIQQLYQQVFGLDPQGARDKLRALVWLAPVVGWLFIAIGVVIILGAAVGLRWRDRGMSFRAAVTRIRRAS